MLFESLFSVVEACVSDILQSVSDIRQPSLRDMKVAAASILHLERQIRQMQQIIPDLLHFAKEIWDKASREYDLLQCKLICAMRLIKAMLLQSAAIALHKNSVQEKKAVENNSNSVYRELRVVEGWLSFHVWSRHILWAFSLLASWNDSMFSKLIYLWSNNRF